MTRTQQRRVVAQRVPMDVLAPTSTALCAGADDDYTAPKIEFDPDAPAAGGRDSPAREDALPAQDSLAVREAVSVAARTRLASKTRAAAAALSARAAMR